MPNYEVLDARIASALDRIIHNSRRIFTKGPERELFRSWKTDRLFDLRVLPGHRSQ